MHRRMGITEAFKFYGAEPTNARWSVSSLAQNGELIVSLWQMGFRRTENGCLIYSDDYSNWNGHGMVEFREKVTDAYRVGRTVRLVIAIRSIDGTNYFIVRPDLMGQVTEATENGFCISFQAM